MARAAGDKRYYEFLLNGDPKLPSIKLTSVTTILHDVFGANQHVVDWAANNFKNADEMRAYRDTRAEEGTKAHDFVERFVADPTIDVTPGYGEAFLRFNVEHEPVFTHSETVVFSLEFGYAGTLDLGLLESGGVVRIVDVKTKKKTIYKAYLNELLQCRMYAIAAHEMGLIDRPDGPTGILILKDNGRYTYDTREVPVSMAAAVIELWQEMQAA